MTRLQSLRVVKEFLLGESDTSHALPPLDAGLHPNNALEECRPIAGEVISGPSDLVRAPDGALLVASGRRVIRCSPANHADRSVLLEAPGPIRCLAMAQDGSLLAGVDDVGLVHVDGAGRQRVLAREVAGTGCAPAPPSRSGTAPCTSPRAAPATPRQTGHGTSWRGTPTVACAG
jgi:hypothetical protein